MSNMISAQEDIQIDVKNSFKAFEKSLNGTSTSYIHQIRRKAFEFFQKNGLPDHKNEEYKYFNITRLLNKNFSFENTYSSNQVTKEEFDHIAIGGESISLVFINGQFNQDFSDLSLLNGKIVIQSFTEAYKDHKEDIDHHFSKYADFTKDAFIALNTSFSKDGIYIKVDDGQIIEKPIYLYFITDTRAGKNIVYPRNLVTVGSNSQVKLVEFHHHFGDDEIFTNMVSEYAISKDSIVDYYKVQDDNPLNYQVNTTVFHQEDRSVINTYAFSLGGKMVRNNLNISLDAKHAESNMYGLYALNKSSHVDNHTTVDHRQPDSFSNELYKGILNDQSTGVFNGKIYVQQIAQKTNAFQSNKNILLSDDATINTKPQLEIWADDVKCSHGCTTGQMDDEALFYLRSRGLDLESARAFLLFAFAEDVMEKVKIPELREYLENSISKRLY